MEASYGDPVSYTISSIAVAIFLVVTFAGADFRGSVALLFTLDRYNMVLGLVILASFVLLVISSISALFFLGGHDVSFIVGAAAVLFISDLVSRLSTPCYAESLTRVTRSLSVQMTRTVCKH